MIIAALFLTLAQPVHIAQPTHTVPMYAPKPVAIKIATLKPCGLACAPPPTCPLGSADGCGIYK